MKALGLLGQTVCGPVGGPEFDTLLSLDERQGLMLSPGGWKLSVLGIAWKFAFYSRNFLPFSIPSTPQLAEHI